MKFFIAAFLLLSQGAFAQERPEFNEIRQCFQTMFKIPNKEEHEKKAMECYEKAKVFATSRSLSGRSLYVQSMSYVQPDPDTFADYQSLLKQSMSAYDELISPSLQVQKMGQLTSLELLDALDAIDNASFYSFLVSPAEPCLAQAEMLFRELMRRNALNDHSISVMFGLLTRNSEYQKAKKMSLRWPQLGFFPDVNGMPVNARSLTYFELSKDAQSLKPVEANIGRGPRIVMYGDCHFAYDLMKDLSAHDDLDRIMYQLGLVVSGANDTDFAEIDQLRKKFPSFEMHTLYKQGSWGQSGFNVMESPNMVFLLDGVAKFSFGKSGPLAVGNFCQGLKSIQVPTPKSCGG